MVDRLFTRFSCLPNFWLRAAEIAGITTTYDTIIGTFEMIHAEQHGLPY